MINWCVKIKRKRKDIKKENTFLKIDKLIIKNFNKLIINYFLMI